MVFPIQILIFRMLRNNADHISSLGDLWYLNIIFVHRFVYRLPHIFICHNVSEHVEVERYPLWCASLQ